MSEARSVAWQNYADGEGISPHSEPERGVFEGAWDAAHAALQPVNQKPHPLGRPDDSEADAAIADADNLTEALWEIAEKYQVPVTNNYERWQDGQWLREIGEFIGDIQKAIERFPAITTPQSNPDECDHEFYDQCATCGVAAVEWFNREGA